MSVKITVIIPTYKRTKLLIRCLEALVSQSIPKEDFQVIVVSDGPDLQTQKALETWRMNNLLSLNYVQTPFKGGPAAARNYGWKMAHAPLIAFTDDDCIPDRLWLDAFLMQYFGQPYIAFTGKTQVPLPEKKTDFAINIAQLEQADFITANCACTKAALNKVHGFDERFKMAWREDSDLEFKLITNPIEIVQVPGAMVVHPVREVPWGISIKEQKKGIYDALLFKKFPALYRKKIGSAIWNYYGIIIAAILLVAGLILNVFYLSFFAASALILLFAGFIAQRLHQRHKSFNHVIEIISTSLVIPFISVFWRLYGSIKYRVFFL
ncbi:glycosyltransferase [Pedobacter immunditicola]|uniref:glycosyltransferase n=1 Tax=Pedobacter immunditicola TaxID=3133440 RepID=UPI00309DC864